jgi:hypothetical protein
MQEFDLYVDGFRRIKIYKISLKVGIVLLFYFAILEVPCLVRTLIKVVLT